MVNSYRGLIAAGVIVTALVASYTAGRASRPAGEGINADGTVAIAIPHPSVSGTPARTRDLPPLVRPSRPLGRTRHDGESSDHSLETPNAPLQESPPAEPPEPPAAESTQPQVETPPAQSQSPHDSTHPEVGSGAEEEWSSGN